MGAESSPDQSRDQRPSLILAPEVLETHVQNGLPVDSQKAKLIWLMNKVLHDPEIAWPGEW